MTAERRVRDLAQGRWPGILAQFLDERFLRLGKGQPCPACGGTDRFTFTNVRGMGDYICRGCGPGPGGHGDGFDLLQAVMGWDFAAAAREVEKLAGSVPVSKTPEPMPAKKAAAMMTEIWQGTQAIQPDDPVDRYLHSRGVEPCYPLRYHPRVRYFDKETQRVVGFYPCMVSPVHTSAGKAVTLHLTYLTHEGAKADVPKPRKVMPPVRRRVAGMVRLGGPAGACLGVAEGIETALSAEMLFQVQTWACINAGNMAKWWPPEGVEKVLVFGDCDPKYGGQKAAYTLAHRLACRGLDVEVHIPPSGDWNNAL